MITTTVKVFDRFATITGAVDRLAEDAVDAAAREAAEVAQAEASIDLQLELIPGHGDVEGYSAGIKARRTSDRQGSTTPIAIFFDKGTLGRRRGRLSSKTRREQSWTVKRGGSVHTAHRGEINADTGIPAERFFLKARAAGRRRLHERLDRGPTPV